MSGRMAMPLKTQKKAVELGSQAGPRVSRIRRDPATVAKLPDPDKPIEWWRTDEGEIKLAIIGIVLFALAIDIIVIAIGAYWS